MSQEPLNEETQSRLDALTAERQRRFGADPWPAPAPRTQAALPAWLPMVASIVLLIAQQMAVAFQALPPSAPITIALLVLNIVTATIPGIQAILQSQQAHRERLAMIIRRQA